MYHFAFFLSKNKMRIQKVLFIFFVANCELTVVQQIIFQQNLILGEKALIEIFMQKIDADRQIKLKRNNKRHQFLKKNFK